ncbi:MAG TPA: Ig-like domain-containing protein [Nevskiaceae bacterium]|nr:Ig-like domain-containing protein [Nevskiaceae bacterium]
MSRLLAALVLTVLLVPPPLQAAGMTTHALMADFGRQALRNEPLKALLTLHRPSLLAGAIHPDGGYGSGVLFAEDREMAERAHWGDFQLAFIDYLQTATPCAEEARTMIAALPAVQNPVGLINPNLLPSERCGRLIAFAFGNAAHGLTDETWDSLFEPVVRERGEDPNPAGFLDDDVFGPFTPAALLRAVTGEAGYAALRDLFGATPLNAIEYAMDIVAIVEQSLWEDAPALELPPAADLVAVYRINRPEQGVTEAMIQRAQVVTRSAVTAERAGAPVEITRIRNQMPWASANYYAGPGGVVDSGYMVAGLYEQMWRQLLARDASELGPPRVIGVHPRHGAVDVAIGREQAGLRIPAFFGHSMDPARRESPGAFRLLDRQGRVVEGRVEPGIYQREFTHTSKFFPAADLRAGERYTVVLTPRLRDQRGARLADRYSWSFTTAP